MRLGGPRGRYGVAKAKRGALRQSVGYLFWWREREANRISHSLERSPEAFPPSSGACNGIPLHTPLLGSNRHSNPAFERTCAHPGRVPRLLAHPALALALASALAVDTPSHLLSHGHRLSHRLLHRLLLASAASLSCISSALASALATRLRAYGARVVSLESVSCLLVGAPRAPPTSAGAITAAPPTPRANPSAPSRIQTTELDKGLAAPGPPRCEDARTLPTAPASRLHSYPSHFICSSIHCSRIAALHLHHKQLSSQTACLICRSPILLHRSPTFAA